MSRPPRLHTGSGARYGVPVDVEPRDPAKIVHLEWVRTAVVYGAPVRGARFGLVQR